MLISETDIRGICKLDEGMKNRNRPDTQGMKKGFSARSPRHFRLLVAEKVRYMCWDRVVNGRSIYQWSGN